MEDINRMKLHMKILVIGLALFAIMIALHYNLGTFQSAPADPRCPRGRYSKRTGGICTGPSPDTYDDSQDLPETALGANGERHNVGSYDRKPNRKDDVDYTSSDVLKKPGSMKYPDWVLDPSTSRDINTGSRVSDRQFRSPKGLDDDDLPSRRSPKSPYDYRYDTSLNSAGHSLDDVYDSSYDTEKKFDRIRKRRQSVDELEDTYNKNNSRDSEDDYMNSRLSRDQISRERQFDLPSSSSYKTDNTTAYDSSCNTKSYEDEDEVCEGFSPLL